MDSGKNFEDGTQARVSSRNFRIQLGTRPDIANDRMQITISLCWNGRSAIGGHRFWNPGPGWIRARDLEPQTLLHTVTGNTPLWLSKKGNTAETYNLVVADFHTCFVGNTGVLCQDLLIPRGTNSVVPGMVR